MALLQILFASHGLSQPNCSVCGNTLEIINGEYHCRYCNPENFGAAGSVSEQLLSEGAVTSLGLLCGCMYQLLTPEDQIKFFEHANNDDFSEIPLGDASYKIKREIRKNVEFLKENELTVCSSNDESSVETDVFMSVIEEILKAINGIESVTSSAHVELVENALEVHNNTSNLNLIYIFEFNTDTSESDFNDTFSSFQNNDSTYITITGKNSAPIITLPVALSTLGYSIIVGNKTFCFSEISFYQLLTTFLKKLKSVVGRKNVCSFRVYVEDHW